MKLILLSLVLACGGKKTDAAEAAADRAEAAAETAESAAEVAQEAASDAQAAADAAGGAADDPYAPMTTSEDYAVYRGLSVRDPQPECADIEALSSTPLDSLLRVVDRAEMPPWVPMRAAACLVQDHGAEVQDTLLAWVTGDDTRGLAILVFDQIDALPEDVALAVAEAALSGPYADDASSRIAKSTSPALVALVEGGQ